MQLQIANYRLQIAGYTRRFSALKDDRLARNTALVFLNNLLTAGAGMLFWLLVVYRATPMIVGQATAGTSMAILLAGISQLGLGIALIRFGAALGPRRAQRLVALFLIITIAALLVSGTFVGAAAWLAPGLSPVLAAPADGAWFAVAVLGWALAVQYENYLMSRRFMGLVVVKTSITGACRLALLLLWPAPSAAMLIGITGISGLLGMFAVAPWALTRRAAPDSEECVAWGTLLTYSFWSYLTGLAGILPALLIPTIILTRAGGPAAAAYSMAWALFSVLLFVPSALSWVLFAEQRRATAPLHGSRVLLGLPLVFLPAALAMLAALGHDYLRLGALSLAILTLGFWPYARSQILLAELRLGASQSLLTGAYAVSHLGIIALCGPLLAWVGMPGAALAWLLGQLMLWVALSLVSRTPTRRSAHVPADAGIHLLTTENSMEQALVSVIIPVKNAAAILPICLTALKRQTYPSIEVIIIDNGSSDATVATAQAHGATVMTASGLPSAARNAGARAAHGAIVLHLDADMELAPESVAQCVAAIATGANLVILPERNVARGYWMRAFSFGKELGRGAAGFENGRCMPRAWFEQIGGYDEQLWADEDRDLHLRLLAAGAHVGRITALTLHHIEHLTIGDIWRKTTNYARTRVRFERKHGTTMVSRRTTLPRLALARWRLMVRSPFIAAGWLMLTAAFVARDTLLRRGQ